MYRSSTSCCRLPSAIRIFHYNQCMYQILIAFQIHIEEIASVPLVDQSFNDSTSDSRNLSSITIEERCEALYSSNRSTRVSQVSTLSSFRSDSRSNSIIYDNCFLKGMHGIDSFVSIPSKDLEHRRVVFALERRCSLQAFVWLRREFLWTIERSKSVFSNRAKKVKLHVLGTFPEQDLIG